jgi:hypothetical protein
MSGTPPTVNPGMTPGVERIYDALEARFGRGEYFLDADGRYVGNDDGIGWTHMGGWNRRRIAGSTTWSQHAWWNALDIGPLVGVAAQREMHNFLTGNDTHPPLEEPMTPTQARIEVATAWYAKAGVWMDGISGEDPQARLTRLAKQHLGGRTLADIVQHINRVANPQPGEAVPAWVLDPTQPASAPIYGGGATTAHQHDARYVRRGDHTIKL